MDPWGCKPPEPVIQRDHPFADRLVFCWVPTDQNVAVTQDLVTGYKGAGTNLTNASHLAQTKYGQAVKFVAASSTKLTFLDKALYDPTVLSGFTVSVWIRADALTNATYFIGKYTASGWGLGFDGSSIQYVNNSDVCAKTPALTAGKAYHIVAVWDGAQTRIFTDAVQGADVACSAAPISTTNALTLGALSASFYSTVSLAGAMIWRRPFSAAEAKALYSDPWAVVRGPNAGDRMMDTAWSSVKAPSAATVVAQQTERKIGLCQPRIMLGR